MTRTVNAAERDISRIRDLPFGPARTRAAEAEVARLQAEGPPEALDYGLFALVEAYTFSEEAAKAFVPFTQLLRLFDDHPEYFDPYDRHSVFWAYKWMVGDLMEFPEVPASQIESTLADMRHRYTVAGNGMNAVHLMEFYWAMERDAPDLEERYQEWVATPRDDFSQCEACEPGDRAVYLAEHGRPQEAVDIIEQTLTTNPRCGTEPADMLSQLALCYLDVGRPDDAVVAFYRAIAEMRNADGPMAGARGRQLELLVRATHRDRAIRHLADNEALLHSGAGAPSRRLQYLCRVGSATRTWLDNGWQDATVALREPGPLTISQLHQWAWEQAEPLARAFDARNGNAQRTERTRAAFARQWPTQDISLDVMTDRSTRATTPATPVRPTAQGDTKASPAQNFARAERVAGRDPATAASLYHQASQGFTKAGDAQRAGFALAEAAHCAQVVGDMESAAESYRLALQILLASGSGYTALTPIASALIAALADHGDASALAQATEAAQEHRAGVTAEPDDTPGRAIALAQLRETHARLIATQGDYEAAVSEAREVTQAFLDMNDEAAAASGMALAGRILTQNLGRHAEAEPLLRKACETYAGMTAGRDALVETANTLIAALQAQGRMEEAQQVADQLS